MTRTLFPVAGLLAACLTAAALPRLPADPAGYKTLDQAQTTTVRAQATAAGYLGVTVERDATGRPVVEAVQPGSPADTAGVKRKDVLTHVGGRPVASPDSFREWVQAHAPGESVKVGLLRDGKDTEVTAKLSATSRPMKLAAGGPAGAPRVYVGVTFGEAKEGEGVKVDQVANGSPAETAGLKAGDRVVKVNGTDFSRQEALRDLLSEKKPGDTLTFTVRRGEKETEVKVPLAAATPRFGGGDGTIAPWKKPIMRLAVIGIDFADAKHNAKNTPEALEKLLCKPGSGGLADYLGELSAGAFKLEGKAFPWVEVEKKRGDYVQGSGTSNKTAPLSDALDKLLAREGKDALKDFDALAFVYAGERVQSNRGAVYYPHAGVVTHQMKRHIYLLVPEGGATLSPLNVLVKPAGQLLGLPDLAARPENVGSEGLGVWCAMSDVPRTGKPPHFSAWCKERLGWLKPAVIDPTVKQKLILGPVEGSGKECVKVLVRPDGSEYFLLENRRKTGFDDGLPGEGLLVWRVVNDRPTLEESHGVEGPDGPRVHLPNVPYPSPANTAFTPDTVPSSRSPAGGGLPVHLTNFRRLPDGRVTFQVGFVYE